MTPSVACEVNRTGPSSRERLPFFDAIATGGDIVCARHQFREGQDLAVGLQFRSFPRQAAKMALNFRPVV